MRSNLSAAALDDGPGDMAGGGLRCMFRVGTSLACLAAGTAVIGAPAKVPLRESDQTFFSSPSVRMGMT